MPLAVRLAVLAALLAVAGGCAGSGPAAPPVPAAPPALTADQADRLDASLGAFLDGCRSGGCALPVGRGVEVDTVLVAGGAVEVRFSRDLGDAPVRPATAEAFRQSVADAVGAVVPGAPVRVVTRGVPLAALVPNAYRDPADRDASRLFAPPVTGPPLVRPAAPVWEPAAGLAGRHLAMWPSHGWLYNAASGAWGWQRARLFTTIEDLYTVQLVTETLVPMLERAGAVVLLPRERDPQAAGVVVDDGGPRATPRRARGRTRGQGSGSATPTPRASTRSPSGAPASGRRGGAGRGDVADGPPRPGRLRRPRELRRRGRPERARRATRSSTRAGGRTCS